MFMLELKKGPYTQAAHILALKGRLNRHFKDKASWILRDVS